MNTRLMTRMAESIQFEKTEVRNISPKDSIDIRNTGGTGIRISKNI
ncbi:hypothetical protein [Chryseobacterium bernardetii]